MSNKHTTLVASDQEILAWLQADDSVSQDRALRALYQQHFQMITQLVLRNSGREDDAADIFQDGLVALFHKVREPGFTLTAALKTLLYAICRNLWLMKLRKHKRETPLTEVHHNTVSLDADALDLMEENDRNQLINKGLKEIGPDCQQVLQLYYFERCRMSTIAEQMGYSGEQVAKNKKSRCMRKLREWMKSHPLAAELF